MKNKKGNLVRGILLAVVLVAAFTAPLLAGSGEGAADGGGFYGTAWALLPPVIAIGLALITKEVYSSLFIGILMGGCFIRPTPLRARCSMCSRMESWGCSRTGTTSASWYFW